MKKYYLSNGKEVKVGDTMVLEVKNSNGMFKSEFTFIESIIPTLIEHGVIVCKEEKESKEPPKDLQYYIKNISKTSLNLNTNNRKEKFNTWQIIQTIQKNM